MCFFARACEPSHATTDSRLPEIRSQALYKLPEQTLRKAGARCAKQDIDLTRLDLLIVSDQSVHVQYQKGIIYKLSFVHIPSRAVLGLST
jgi:hypothetical protein